MISLCMIVKNETEILERCISSVKTHLKNVVDDIVVVDTGSTDGTRELAESLGCRVYDFEWCNDFSKARNFSLSKAKNNWILHLDADDFIYSVNESELIKFCKINNENILGIIKIQEIDDNDIVKGTSNIPRIFNKNVYHFEGIIHETVYRKKQGDTPICYLNLIVKHTGYFTAYAGTKNKTERNKTLILEHLKNNPDDDYMFAKLGEEYMSEGAYTQAIECLEKVVFGEEHTNMSYYVDTVCKYLGALIASEQYNIAVLCENMWDYCKNNDLYLYYMGVAYIKDNQLEKGLDALLQCVNKQGETSIDKRFAYFELAQLFESIGELEQAIICYKECIDADGVQDKINELEQKLN